MPRPLFIGQTPAARSSTIAATISAIGQGFLSIALAIPAYAQFGPIPSASSVTLGQPFGASQLDGTGHIPINELPIGTTAASVAAGNDSRFSAPAITGGTIGGTAAIDGIKLGFNTPLPQINIGAALTFNGADSPANKPLNANGTLAGSATSQQSSVYNFAISSDQAAAPNGWINDFNVSCTMGGGNFAGIRDCMASGVAVVGSANTSDTSSRNYVSNIATAYATVNDGGTAGPYAALGSITGYNANVRLATNANGAATFWNVLQAQENDVTMMPGTSAASLYGLSIDQVGGHAVQGTYDDTGLVFSNTVGAIGWRCGICFGNSYAAWPMAATGATLIGAVAATRANTGQPMPAQNGIDFRAVTFNGYALATPGFTVDPAGNLAAANIAAPSIASAGSVTAVTASPRGQYPANIFPALTIAAPPGAGSTATAAVSSMGWTGGPAIFVDPGAGCSVNDILTPSSYTGTPFQFKITSISGSGAVTGFTPAGNGAGNLTAPFASSTLTMSGGTCTAAPAYAANFYINTVTVTGGGNGYLAPPAVTSAPSSLGNTATLASAINNAMVLSGSSGKIIMNSSGTTLGLGGTAGAPVILASAMVDGSKLRLTATGGTYAVPANTSWLALVQTAPVASQAITLPQSPVDGQLFRLSTAGKISALTLSPSAAGWTNGAPLPANSAFQLGWDAGSSTWMAAASPVTMLVNLPVIAPATTSLTSSPATIFPAAAYVSIRIAPLTSGTQMACTGDGTTPIIGASATVSYGQDLHWPDQPGGAMPTGAVQCVSTAAGTIQTEAH